MNQTRVQTDNEENLGSISHVVLSEQVKEVIVEAILTGEYEPGDRIVESALARQLGVSQAPVREAIRDLVLLGFLDSEPYKGTSVKSFSIDELVEVYTVRAALESLAARLAAERLTEEDAQRLQSILVEMIKAAENKDAKAMVRLDNSFHETVLEISGNSLLHKVWRTLQFGYWTIVTTKMSSFDLEYLARRHKELLTALLTKEPEQAQMAMRKHIEDLGTPPISIPSKSNENAAG